MRNDTRVLFNAFLAHIAQLNGIPNANTQFTVSPSVQQTLENRIQESDAFLQRINIIGVDEMKGESLGLTSNSTIASRTNTDAKDRATSDPTGLSSDTYDCIQTNFDTHINYATIDAWAKFPDFQIRMRNAILRQQGLDRIMIGFNGTSRAADTNRTANSLLQDVNKGWLQKIREKDAGLRVLSGEQVGGARFKTLDALVFDAYNELLDPWHRDVTNLVAIVGRGLLHDKYFGLVNTTQPPTEQIASGQLMSSRRIGELQAEALPFVPENSILVTSFDNLSIYYQNGKRRRSIIDNPKRNRIENYESSNDDYVIEDFGRACLIENISFA